MADERILQRREVLEVGRQTLDGLDRRAVREQRGEDTGRLHVAVDKDGAGAAYADAATLFRAGQAQVFPYTSMSRRWAGTVTSRFSPLIWKRS